MKQLLSTKKRGLAVGAMALGIAAGTSVSTPAPAEAATSISVDGLACGSGYITAFFWYTSTDSGAADNFSQEPGYSAWEVTLNDYTWGQTMYVSVKCNNDQWYYPSFQVYGPATTTSDASEQQA